MLAGSGLRRSQPFAVAGTSRLIASPCDSRLIAAAAFDDFRRLAARD
jgi:hypothetical protein